MSGTKPNSIINKPVSDSPVATHMRVPKRNIKLAEISEPAVTPIGYVDMISPLTAADIPW